MAVGKMFVHLCMELLDRRGSLSQALTHSLKRVGACNEWHLDAN